MLTRRAVLAGSASAAVVCAAPAHGVEMHSAQPAIAQYWNIRSVILHTLQKPFMGTGNVVLLGDSRLESGTWVEIAGRKVHNCALAGIEYSTIAPYLPEILSQLRPAAVIVALGLWTESADIEAATKHAEAVLEQCRRSSRVCAVAMPGWEAGFGGGGRRRQTLRARGQKLSARCPWRISSRSAKDWACRSSTSRPA